MIKCPNGCQVIPDALTHNCTKHERAIAEGKPFKCRIKNCKLAERNKLNKLKEITDE